MENYNEEFDYYKNENRLKTFTDWPFTEDCVCTPEKLSDAGFIYCGSTKEPDLVRCFVCFKELASWEPEDDPWKEHEGHSGHCPFIKVKDSLNFTVREFIQMEKTRALSIVEQDLKKTDALWENLLPKFEATKLKRQTKSKF